MVEMPEPVVLSGKTRTFTWIIAIINVLLLAWIAWAVILANKWVTGCGKVSQNLCTAGYKVGNFVPWGYVIAICAAIDIVLAICWMVTRRPDASKPPKAGTPTRYYAAAPVADAYRPVQPSYVGPFRGAGAGVVDVAVPLHTKLTFTCGGTWGRTMLIMDGRILVDTAGAKQISLLVDGNGGVSHLVVNSEGTWTIHLEQVRQPVATG